MCPATEDEGVEFGELLGEVATEAVSEDEAVDAMMNRKQREKEER